MVSGCDPSTVAQYAEDDPDPVALFVPALVVPDRLGAGLSTGDAGPLGTSRHHKLRRRFLAIVLVAVRWA